MDKKKEKRNRQVQIRLTASEYETLEKKAAEENRTVSNFIRCIVLEKVTA